MNGDPLGLRRLVGERMRRRAYLLDADQVHLRAVARCARFAVRYRGQPAINRWLAEIVDEAMGDLVTEEHERTPDPAGRMEGGVFHELSLPLGLDPARMRAACARFNALSENERSLFFALVIDSRSLDEVAHGRGASASTVARGARVALDALLGASQAEPERAPS
jgi:DNA-directed RNA polymerase specialized sigma24 family protein